jgi:hypothetical protein
MNPELRSSDEARTFVVQGLRWQRLLPPSAPTVQPALQWALEIVSGGQPLPPIGFVADMGNALFSPTGTGRQARQESEDTGMKASLGRAYEDHVLGKIYADASLERAADALRHYRGRDQSRGLAFVFEQMRQRTALPGVFLSPAVLKSLLREAPEQVLAAGLDSLSAQGPCALLTEMYESLVASMRRAADLLGPEDLFELEHGTALRDLGQRVALRQVLRAADVFEKALCQYRPRPRPARREVPTRGLDEDAYPVGGFSSLSTRGSIESLLHSQLAYMEPEERPDLFDLKYLRDELLYYARDENQLLRRRQTLVFALWPDLAAARFKDREVPYQQIIVLLAWIVAAVRRRLDWQSSDALAVLIVFVGTGELAAEQSLMEMIFREQITGGTVTVQRCAGLEALEQLCAARARRSACHCLSAATADRPLQGEGFEAVRLQLETAKPVLRGEIGEEGETGEAMESWAEALGRLWETWM